MTRSLPQQLGDALLTRRSYLIRTRFDSDRKVDAYEIADPETGAVLGVGAEIGPGRWARSLRAFFGRNLLLTAAGVYHADSGRRAFSIHEIPSLWSASMLVRDADGRRLCSFHGRFAVIGGGFVVIDSLARRIGRLEAEHEGAPYQLTTVEGRRVGAVLEAVNRDSGKNWVDRYAVVRDEVEEAGEAGGLLLLASALALDLAYRARV